MDDSVLEHAALALRRHLLSPMRVEGTDRFAKHAFAFIVDDRGRRSRLVLDVDPSHATLHLEPVPRRESWRGGFGQRLRGAFLVDARLVAGDRRLEIDLAVRTIEPRYRLHVAWHGRGGNLWLVDLGDPDAGPAADEGRVIERLGEVGPAPEEPWAARPPDPRLHPGTHAGDEVLAPRLGHVLATHSPDRWLREIPRFLAVSRPVLWQALTDVLGPGEGGDTAATGPETLAETPPPEAKLPESTAAWETLARAVLTILASPRSGSSHAYRLPPGACLALGPTQGELPATGWGLPEAWISLGELPAFAAFEVDPAEGPSDPKADGGRLFWLLARTHRQLLRSEAEARRRQGYRTRITNHRRRISRIAENIRSELSDAEGPQLRSWAEAILSHLHQVRRGDEVLICPDLADPDGAELRIPLDPSRPATEVAESYFRRARRWQKGREMREMRLGHAERALAGLEALAEELSGADEVPAHDEIEARLRGAMGPFYRGPRPDPAEHLAGGGETDPGSTSSRPGGKPGRRRPDGSALPDPTHRASGRSRGDGGRTTSRGRVDPAARFRPRVYRTSEGWTVIVGRSNLENDYVTTKLAKQDDYWFHAHGVPGSHVVLKREGRKDNPSKKTIEEAAAIAAFFSKARSSGRAPVIYTLAKYVTKPRKAKPGLVTCTRERSILVRPSNPEPDTPPEWED